MRSLYRYDDRVDNLNLRISCTDTMPNKIQLGSQVQLRSTRLFPIHIKRHSEENEKKSLTLSHSKPIFGRCIIQIGRFLAYVPNSYCTVRVRKIISRGAGLLMNIVCK